MILSPHTKQPAETYKLAIDFARRLQATETLSTPTVTSKNKLTGADTTAAIISQVVVNGTKVEARVSAGVAGDDHIVQFHSTTNLANSYQDELWLLVRED